MKKGIILNLGKNGEQGFGWPRVPGIRKFVQLDFFDQSYLLVEQKSRTMSHDDLVEAFLKDINVKKDNPQFELKGCGIVAFDAAKRYAAFSRQRNKCPIPINADHLKLIKTLYPHWTFMTPGGQLRSEIPMQTAHQQVVSTSELRKQAFAVLV